MIHWSSYHVHSRYDDGKGEPRDYVRAALEAGLEHLGFSGHNPMPFPTDWEMPAADLPRYLQEVRGLREEFRDRLTIFLGMEADYLPGVRHPRSPEIGSLGLDYVIGSVHFLGQMEDGRYWTIDYTPEELAAGLRHSFGGDAVRLVREYFGRVRAMAEQAPPDVVGHFDLLKLNNRGGLHFDEQGDPYRAAAREALEAVAAAGCIVEVSTAALYRRGLPEAYPSDWILRQCLELGVPVLLSADAHAPENIVARFPETARHLRELGFRTQRILTPSGWQDRPLPD